MQWSNSASMMLTMKSWQTTGTFLSVRAVIFRIVSSCCAFSRHSICTSWESACGRGMLGISLGSSRASKKIITLNARGLGLLRREAQARLQEKDQKSCILLSPEDKICERLSNYGSLFPCPCESKQPPRIEHLLCLEDGNVVELVSKALALPSSYVEELIHFGAIYYALVCPPPPKGSLTPAQMELYKRASVLSQDKKRPSLKGKTIAEAQKTFRITSIFEGIEAGMYLRVHVHIKRFPRCYEVNWRSRVIADAESYVVLDKPAGVPVGSAVDNIIECCAVFTAQCLGLQTSLRLTHQLDNCTEGCVVLAKTKEFSSDFHMMLRNKEVKKYYIVLAAAPVPLGKVTHFMQPGRRHPRILSQEPLPGWAICQMEVLECNEVLWPTDQAEAKYHIQDLGWQLKKYAYECKVQIFTGRTHQIRAQFAALGAPLIGDSMYMPAVVNLLKCPEIYPFPSKLKDSNDQSHSCILDIDERALEKWVSQHGAEPECAIGLQAAEISWSDASCFFKAGTPWWRQGEV